MYDACNNLVSFESLYGTWLLFSHNADIQLPSADKDRFIAFASSKRRYFPADADALTNRN